MFLKGEAHKKILKWIVNATVWANLAAYEFFYLLGSFISFFPYSILAIAAEFQYASFFIFIFWIYIHSFCPAFIIIFLPKFWLQCSCIYPFIRQYYPISASLSYMHSIIRLFFTNAHETIPLYSNNWSSIESTQWCIITVFILRNPVCWYLCLLFSTFIHTQLYSIHFTHYEYTLCVTYA